MLLERIAGRELFPTVPMIADPERSMDFELMSEPMSTSHEACSSLEAGFERADVGAEVLHHMFPKIIVNTRSCQERYAVLLLPRFRRVDIR
jgi:hypothetical protein